LRKIFFTLRRIDDREAIPIVAAGFKPLGTGG